MKEKIVLLIVSALFFLVFTSPAEQVESQRSPSAIASTVISPCQQKVPAPANRCVGKLATFSDQIFMLESQSLIQFFKISFLLILLPFSMGYRLPIFKPPKHFLSFISH